MKRLLAFLVIVVGAGLIASWPQPANAGGQFPGAPPLLNCADVDGTGNVRVSDILAVVSSFGKDYPTDEYMLLHDLAINGNLRVDDILVAVGDFGIDCPLIDSQVALATLATVQYRDCQDALADDYFQSTQYVQNMGIHLSKNSNVADYPDFYSGSLDNPNDQIRHPVGLICTDSDPSPGTDVPDKLIGMWYVMPNIEACPFYGNPSTCDDAEPVGFGLTDSDEDNTDIPPQKAWHTHPGLCVWNLQTPQAMSAENVPQSTCEDDFNGVWFEEYGWMVHLYNFIPNDDGRFLFTSSFLPDTN